MDDSDNNNNTNRPDYKYLVDEFRALIREVEVDEACLGDELLDCFIQARKNDLHRARKLLINYLKMTRNYPDLMTNFQGGDIQRILDFGHFLVSPRVDEKTGCRILLLKFGHWDSKHCSLEEMFRTLVFSFQLLVHDKETRLRGVVVVVDVKGLTLRQVRQFYPSILKKVADLLNDVFPIRIVGIHVVFEPVVFKIIVSMIWPFLSAKIRSRIFFHGSCMSSLHRLVDPACLPSNYEGCLPVQQDHMSLTKLFPYGNRANIFECFN